MGAVVVFNYSAWVGSYPEFKTVPQDAAEGYFDLATTYFRNDGGGPVGDPVKQLRLLNLLTAHVAKLFAVVNGQPPSPLVGRIASAGEGTVNVSTEYTAHGSPSQAWFLQTPYGAAFFQATAAYRTMRYAPKPTIVVDSVFPYVPVVR